MQFKKTQQYSLTELSNCIKVIGIDTIEHRKSGHPGIVLGFADVITSLICNFLVFNPNDPKWFNRDRLILSAGHGSVLLYAFYYLSQFVNFNKSDLKKFRTIHSKTPGHPEFGTYSAIEATTGPLGQGFGNAVGMAIAQKKYQSVLGTNISNYKIYCIVGDGCLMEGISYESASIAGHLNLNNLIVLFDSNSISIDGPINVSISEDQLLKFKSLNWEVYSVNGHDFDEINKVLLLAQYSAKPCFIQFNTVIAKDTNLAGSELSHGVPLGNDVITKFKKYIKFQDKQFFIPNRLKKIWKNIWVRNYPSYSKWKLLEKKLNYQEKEYLKSSSEYIDISSCYRYIAKLPEATRVSSGKVIECLTRLDKKIFFGSADLSLSSGIKNQYSIPIIQNNFFGNYIYYGIRESAMSAIMNGLSLSGFISIGSTFFVFSDYMKPGIRLSCIMNLHVIYIFTHDSIGVGEDGPTHQPVEHLSNMRSIPNLLVFRPVDAIETTECIDIALNYHFGPSAIILTRQVVPQIRKGFGVNLSIKGAYIIKENKKRNLKVNIFATGSEVSLGESVMEILNSINIVTRLISVPCLELFLKQNTNYINSIIKENLLNVAIEASNDRGWYRLIGSKGLFFGVKHFGLSGAYKDIYKYFKLEAKDISNNIIRCLKRRNII